MKTIINYIAYPRIWFISGPSIDLVIMLLKWVYNKLLAAPALNINICSAVFIKAVPFLNYDWKAASWNLLTLSGIIPGRFLSRNILLCPANITISYWWLVYWHWFAPKRDLRLAY